MELNQFSKSSKIFASILLLIIIGFGFYLTVFNSYSKESDNATIGSTLVVISIFILLILWFKLNFKKFFGAFSIMIFIVIYFSIEMSKTSFVNSKLENGKVTEAYVIKLKSEIRGKSTLCHYVIIKYYANDKEILQSVDDYDQNYKKGDSIRIIYSIENPEIFKIAGKN